MSRASPEVDSDCTAKRIDVYPSNLACPSGFDLNLGDSIPRMRYRNSLEKIDFIKPSSKFPMTIHIDPATKRFAKGHRIRLDILSSYFPRFDENPNTRNRQASHVVLPIVPKQTKSEEESGCLQTAMLRCRLLINEQCPVRSRTPPHRRAKNLFSSQVRKHG